MKPLILLLLWASCCGSAFAQALPSGELAARACAGESSAENDLEKANTEDLRRMIRNPNCVDKVGARFLLAKRGDSEALQFYACRSTANHSDVIGELLRDDLPKIGGEFTVEIYRQLLDSDGRLQEDLDRKRRDCSDCLLQPLSDMIPAELHKLLPDVPIASLSPFQVQGNPKALGKSKSEWRSWIDSHQSELMRMKPTSSGVNFGPGACSGISDLSTFENRLKAIAGDKALAGDPDTYDSGLTDATNRCVKKAVRWRHAFSAYYVLGGSRVWNVAVGIAGDGKGNVFMLSFDDTGASRAGLGDDFRTFDNGATVVVSCPQPIKLRKVAWAYLTCITSPGNLQLSPE